MLGINFFSFLLAASFVERHCIWHFLTISIALFEQYSLLRYCSFRRATVLQFILFSDKLEIHKKKLNLVTASEISIQLTYLYYYTSVILTKYINWFRYDRIETNYTAPTESQKSLTFRLNYMIYYFERFLTVIV